MPMLPDSHGRFGSYGGRYVPETLMPALLELEEEYAKAKKDKRFQADLAYYLKHYVGRPTSLYRADRLTKKLGGAKIYLKREDLCHTGAHKINNAMGQVLLALRMKKRRIIAETGLASMAWQLPQRPPCSDCNARSIWAPKICNGRR